MAEQIGRRAWLRTLAASSAAASLLPWSARVAEKEPAAAAAPAAPAKPLRFVHLADIHVQPERKADAGLAKCLAAVEALDPKPDFILTGGRPTGC